MLLNNVLTLEKETVEDIVSNNDKLSKNARVGMFRRLVDEYRNKLRTHVDSIKVVNDIDNDDVMEIVRAHMDGEITFSGSKTYRFMRIGSGAFGAVYRFDGKNGKRYAVKVMKYAEEEDSRTVDGKILEKLQGNDSFLKLYFYKKELMVTNYVNAVDLSKIHRYNKIINLDAAKEKLRKAVEFAIDRKIGIVDTHEGNIIVDLVTGNIIICDVGNFKIKMGEQDERYYLSMENNINIISLFKSVTNAITENNKRVREEDKKRKEEFSDLTGGFRGGAGHILEPVKIGTFRAIGGWGDHVVELGRKLRAEFIIKDDGKATKINANNKENIHTTNLKRIVDETCARKGERIVRLNNVATIYSPIANIGGINKNMIAFPQGLLQPNHATRVIIRHMKDAIDKAWNRKMVELFL